MTNCFNPVSGEQREGQNFEAARIGAQRSRRAQAAPQHVDQWPRRSGHCREETVHGEYLRQARRGDGAVHHANVSQNGMNIAFPALFILLLVLPGIILRYTYARGPWRWESPT